MANILSDLASGTSSFLTRFGTELGAPGTLARQAAELQKRQLETEKLQREQQQRQEVIRIRSGQSQPQFARPGGAMPATREEFIQTQLAQLGQLNSPQALEAITELSTRKPQAPLSTIGKIEADITAGFTTPEVGRAAKERALAPRAPLVTFQEESRTKGEEVISAALGARVVKATEEGDLAQDTLASADVIQGAIDRGVPAGPLSNFGAFVVELGDQLGFPINKAVIDKATDIRVVNRELSKGALEKVEKMKGNLSNKDLNFVKEIAGKLGEGKATLQELVDGMVASSRLATQVAQVAERGLLEGIKPRQIAANISKFKRENSVRDIVATIKAERLQQEQAARLQQLQQNPKVQEALKAGFTLEEIDRLMQKRGAR